MVTLEEKIAFFLNELVWREKASSGSHQWASIATLRNESRDDYQKILDSLARLLVGSETCVAVYMDKSEGRIIVAGNDEQPVCARECMKFLSNYANNPTNENYFVLLECSLNNVCQVVSEHTAEIINSLQSSTNNWVNFKSCLLDITYDKKKDLKKLAGLANLAFEETKLIGKVSADWERYLSPFFDTYYIASFLKKYYESKNDPQVYGRRKSLFKLIKKNDDKSIIYCHNLSKIKMHAEMKILTMIISESHLNQEQGYIGISKLCCVPCQLMIDIINEKNPSKEEKRFSTCGTHGGTYPNWVIPDFYQKELLQKIEMLVIRKIRESTSEIPDYFPLILQPPK